MVNYNRNNQNSSSNQSNKMGQKPSSQPNKGANQQPSKSQSMAQSNVAGGANKPSQPNTNQSELGNKTRINKETTSKDDQKKGTFSPEKPMNKDKSTWDK